MGSRPRRSFTSMPLSMRSTRRRSKSHRDRVCKPQKNSGMISNGSGGTGGCTSVSNKLEALKNLISVHIDGEEIKADDLFQETADYIVLLRTQILVLQKLINFYGSSQNDQNAV